MKLESGARSTDGYKNLSQNPNFCPPWPIRRTPAWKKRVNEALTQNELEALRRSAKHGCPFGDEKWLKRKPNDSDLNRPCDGEVDQELEFPKKQNNES